jgi:hypothetical protein
VSAPQETAAPRQTPAPQTSSVVHAFASSHAVPSATGVWVQPPPPPQPSIVHALPSSHAAGAQGASAGRFAIVGGLHLGTRRGPHRVHRVDGEGDADKPVPVATMRAAPCAIVAIPRRA